MYKHDDYEPVLSATLRVRNQKDLEELAKILGMPRLAGKTRRIRRINWPLTDEKVTKLL
jgi:hypothetical protein